MDHTVKNWVDTYNVPTFGEIRRWATNLKIENKDGGDYRMGLAIERLLDELDGHRRAEAEVRQQVASLKNQGWTVDDECHRLQVADERVAAPTYVKAPDGRVHAVTADRAMPLDGPHRVCLGRFPVPGRDVPNRVQVYQDGVVAGMQG